MSFIARGEEEQSCAAAKLQLLLVRTAGSSVSHCIIQQPWYFSLSFLWHPNAQLEEKRFTHIFKYCTRSFQQEHLHLFCMPTCEPSVGTVWVIRLACVCVEGLLRRVGRQSRPGGSQAAAACWRLRRSSRANCPSVLPKGRSCAALHTAECLSFIPKCWFFFFSACLIFLCSCQIQQNVLIPARCLHLVLLNYVSNDSLKPLKHHYWAQPDALRASWCDGG